MKTFRIATILIVFSLFFACTVADEPPVSSVESEEEVVVEEYVEENPVILKPVQNEGLISFLTGDVFIIKNNEERYAEIGDSIGKDDSIRTGNDGFCEIQIGSATIISIMEDTSFAISTVSLKEEGNTVKAKVVTGAIALKVNKLLRDDLFTIETPSVACGVRGTQFMVRVQNDLVTEIAVSEGKVAIIPPESEILLELKKTAPEELAAVLEEVLKIETTIEAGMELVIEAEDLKPMAQQLKQIVDEVKNYEEKSDDEKSIIINYVESSAGSVNLALETISEPEPLAAANKELLKPLETKVFLSIQTPEDQKIETKPVEYRALVIHVVPEDAEIYLDGQLRGVGQISALYPLETKMDLLLKAPGFEDTVEEILVSKTKPTRYSYSLERVKRELSIKVEPSDAVIYLNKDELNEGNHTGLYPVGSTLIFTARREGYNPASIEVSIDENNKLEYLISLSRGPRPFSLSVTPDDSEITIDGEKAGVGNSSGEYTFGTEINVEVNRTGYKPFIKSFILNETVPNELSINLSLIDVELTIKPYPVDARISINGKAKILGQTTVSFPFNSEVDVVVERTGYESENLVIELSSPDPVTRSIQLKALPLYGRYKLGSNSIVGDLLISEDRIVAADKGGFLHGITINGTGKWSYNTANGNNEAASPIRLNDSIMFAGTKRFIAVSKNSGSVTYQKDLGSQDSLPFGNKPIYTEQAIIYPEQSGLRFLDPENFSELGFLSLPKLLMTTPSVLGNEVYIMDSVGTLHAVSLSDYTISWSSQTPLKQPAGLGLTISDGKGYIGDTKGNVVSVDLSDGSVLWSAKMPKRVTSDIVVDKNLAYILSDGAIHRLSIADGTEQQPPLTGAVTHPLVTEGRIYYENDQNKLTVINTNNNELLYEYELNSTITTCPKKIGTFIIVGLESGEIAIINEEAFDL